MIFVNFFIVALETELQQRQEIQNLLDQLLAELKLQESIVHKVEGDLFVEVMRPFYEQSKLQFENYVARVESSIHTFKSLVSYYGDDASTAQPKPFFLNLISFVNNFKRYFIGLK